jgi:hypothetical protein
MGDLATIDGRIDLVSSTARQVRRSYRRMLVTEGVRRQRLCGLTTSIPSVNLHRGSLSATGCDHRDDASFLDGLGEL